MPLEIFIQDFFNYNRFPNYTQKNRITEIKNLQTYNKYSRLYFERLFQIEISKISLWLLYMMLFIGQNAQV